MSWTNGRGPSRGAGPTRAGWSAGGGRFRRALRDLRVLRSIDAPEFPTLPTRCGAHQLRRSSHAAGPAAAAADDGRFLLRTTDSGGAADLDFRFGQPDDIPVVGDFNGDGISTVGVRRVTQPEPEVRTASQLPDVSGTLPADSQVWADLTACESNNIWQAVSANGLYYGGLQFYPTTWATVGGSGLPNQASRAEQIHRAQLLLTQP
ncbi:MAG: hypothetical protein EA340_07145 [Nitriliruptor sp.]|nr:MAG: hypothetical protein EA340_07145 [Nitriliruptor sp.]